MTSPSKVIYTTVVLRSFNKNDAEGSHYAPLMMSPVKRSDGGGCGGFKFGGGMSRSEYAASISPGYLGAPPPSRWTCIAGDVQWELDPKERR